MKKLGIKGYENVVNMRETHRGMKAFTDIKQSKKLAEILPLESSDMSWAGTGLGKPFARTIPCKGYPEEICPCWSLAALLSHIPNVSLHHTPSGWRADSSTERKTVFGPSQDNSIDACVEMILKLHEQKLL